jgi:hypothetical protein
MCLSQIKFRRKGLGRSLYNGTRGFHFWFIQQSSQLMRLYTKHELMNLEYRENNSNRESHSTQSKNSPTVTFLTIYVALSGLGSNPNLNAESSVTVLTLGTSCTCKLIDMSIMIVKEGSTSLQ